MTVSEKEILKEELKEEITRELFETFLDTINNSNDEKKEKLLINVDGSITKALLEIGIPRNLNGFHYLRFAISICVKEDMQFCSVMKVLYPRVSETFNTTPPKVERSMRHAIEVAWDRGNIELLNKTFGNTISPSKGRPTVSEFIFLIADNISHFIGL